MPKEPIPNDLEPFMYYTKNDLSQFNIGDQTEIQFGNVGYRVKKEYIGQKLNFVVNNVLEYKLSHSKSAIRLALVPAEKKNEFKTKDVLFLDSTESLEKFMEESRPMTRKPFVGWQNKIVEIIKVNELVNS